MPARISVFVMLTLVVLATHAQGDEPAGPPGARDARLEDLEKEVDRLVQLDVDGARAVELAQELAAAREREQGVDSREHALALRRLARALAAARNWTSAPPLLERALRILERIEPPDDLDLAQARIDYGVTLRGTSRWPEGRALVNAGLATLEEGLPTNDVRTLKARLTRADAHRVSQEFEEGSRDLDRVQAAVDAGVPGSALDVADLDAQLGFVSFEMGRLEAARAAYERTLDARERSLGPEHLLVGRSLCDLAALYGSMGQQRMAEVLYARGIHVLELGPEGHMLALAYANRGTTLLILGRPAAAVHALRRSVALRERLGGSSDPEIAFTLCLLARALLANGDPDEAQGVIERALSIHKRGDAGDWQTYFSSSIAARIAMTRGEHAQGLAWATRAREGYDRTMPLVRRERTEILAMEAELSVLVGHLDRATPLFEQALQLIEQAAQRSLASDQGSQRVARLRLLRAVLDAWLRSAPALGRTGYEEVLRFKGLVARTEAADRRLAREAGADAAPLVEALRTTEARLAAKAGERVPPAPAPEHARWQAEYAALGVQREEQRRALARRLGGYGQSLARLQLGLADVQRAIEPGAVLVDTLRVGATYVAWIVRHEGPPARIDLGGVHEVEQAIRQFRAAVSGLGPSRAEDRAKAGRALADLVWRPIEGQLGERPQRIYLSPDAELAAIPLAALPAGDGTLLDRVAITFVAMAQDLVPRERPAGVGALLVGDVDFERAAGDARAAAPPTPERTLAPISLRGLEERGGFSRLPQTAAEVSAVAALSGPRTAVLRGGEATERALREAVGGRSLVHLATHGFVRSDRAPTSASSDVDRPWLGGRGESLLASEDPMLLAGLAFAGANHLAGGGEDDGILTALEATYLDLRACRLVALSACQTALGQFAPGDGVLGLVQGFQIAGARDVVATLWPVDDTATRLFMGRFYSLTLRAEAPLAVAEALRDAARWLRDTKPEGRDYAHPRYWAAFVAYEGR